MTEHKKELLMNMGFVIIEQRNILMKDKACQRCVNFLELTDKKITCDYDYFEDIPYEQAILYVPEFFDCFKFEEIEE
jgi:hypothetical protein